MVRVQLASFRSRHIPLLRHWLSAEHVRTWFPEPDAVIEWANAPPPAGRQFLAELRGRAVGYIRWTHVSRDVLDELEFFDLPDGAADVDLLIGERDDTGNGIGPAMLEAASDEIRREGLTETVALTTSQRNAYAQRAFTQAGFAADRQYEPEGFGPCVLMIRRV